MVQFTQVSEHIHCKVQVKRTWRANKLLPHKRNDERASWRTVCSCSRQTKIHWVDDFGKREIAIRIVASEFKLRNCFSRSSTPTNILVIHQLSLDVIKYLIGLSSAGISLVSDAALWITTTLKGNPFSASGK